MSYGSLLLTEASKQQLFDFVTNHTDIKNPLKPSDYHVTLFSSDKPIQDPKEAECQFEYEDGPKRFKSAMRVDLLPNGGGDGNSHTVIFALEPPGKAFEEERQRTMHRLGVDHRYPDYVFHVSLSYDHPSGHVVHDGAKCMPEFVEICGEKREKYVSDWQPQE